MPRPLARPPCESRAPPVDRHRPRRHEISRAPRSAPVVGRAVERRPHRAVAGIVRRPSAAHPIDRNGFRTGRVLDGRARSDTTGRAAERLGRRTAAARLVCHDRDADTGDPSEAFDAADQADGPGSRGRLRARRRRGPGGAGRRGRLEGHWVMVSLEINGEPAAEDQVASARLVVEGNRYPPKFDDEAIAETIKLDPAQTPKAIDFTYTDGPRKGEKVKGIYKLEGDRYTMCRPLQAEDPRPTEFASRARLGPGPGRLEPRHPRRARPPEGRRRRAQGARRHLGRRLQPPRRRDHPRGRGQAGPADHHRRPLHGGPRRRQDQPRVPPGSTRPRPPRRWTSSSSTG